MKEKAIDDIVVVVVVVFHFLLLLLLFMFMFVWGCVMRGTLVLLGE